MYSEFQRKRFPIFIVGNNACLARKKSVSWPAKERRRKDRCIRLTASCPSPPAYRASGIKTEKPFLSNKKGSTIECGCFISQYRENTAVSSCFFIGWLHNWGILLVIGASSSKVSTISYKQSQKNPDWWTKSGFVLFDAGLQIFNSVKPHKAFWALWGLPKILFGGNI